MIKSLVITEETAIAKGIRRIIAVTGDEAREALRVANEAEARLKTLAALKGKEREASLKLFGLVGFQFPSWIELNGNECERVRNRN